MNISKRRILIMRSLNHILAIVPLYGCVIVVLTIEICEIKNDTLP